MAIALSAAVTAAASAAAEGPAGGAASVATVATTPFPLATSWEKWHLFPNLHLPAASRRQKGSGFEDCSPLSGRLAADPAAPTLASPLGATSCTLASRGDDVASEEIFCKGGFEGKGEG